MSATIEFNGKKYDAVTGRIIADTSSKTTDNQHVSKVFKPSPGQTLDSVVTSPEKTQSQKKRNHSFNHRDSHPSRRHVEKSHTLMRPAVKKPALKPSEEHSAPARIKLYQEISHARANRAKGITKSEQVKKFNINNPPATSNDVFKPAEVKVAPEPPKLNQETSRSASAFNHPSLAERFDEAMTSAESHLEIFAEEKLHIKKSRKFAYASASFLSVFLIGFAVYQAVPFVRVKVASNKAGFSANLPDYSPSGYGLDGNLQASSGEVKLTYNSRTNDQKYQITQTPSDWNSQSLLSNFVAASNKQYQRIEDNGTTVYLYGDNSATWLDKGVWYRLEGNADLSNDQLLNIIKGL